MTSSQYPKNGKSTKTMRARRTTGESTDNPTAAINEASAATVSRFPIAEVGPLEMAFGGDVDKLMPPYDDIPREFKHGHGWANQLMNDWFYCGVKSLCLEPRVGVDTQKALRHIKAILVSFAPKHQHKEAGVAFLLDQWFTGGTWSRAK